MITIPFDPNIVSGGSFTLSWHGLLTFVAVAVAVFLVGRWAIRERLDKDMVYNTAMWGIVGGIIGARVVHVADNWGRYSNDLGSVFEIWSGGIGLWGAILGGYLGGIAYAFVVKAPVGRLMDLAAPTMLIGQTIGRVGDIINGEHLSRAFNGGWGWIFTHPSSPGNLAAQSNSAAVRLVNEGAIRQEDPVHPTVVYEMIWNVLVLALIWKLRGRVRPDGSLFVIYLTLYALGRFSIQWLRLDPVKFLALQEAHIIAILVLIVTVPWMVMYLRWKRPGSASESGPSGSEASGGRRSGRRRRATA